MTEEAMRGEAGGKPEGSKRHDDSRKRGDFNIFIANTLYPDASSVFEYQPKKPSDLKDDCLVVLDTNALLVPYNIGQDSISQIKSVYEKLIKRRALIIPGQVAREFARNRPGKIAEIYQQISRKRNVNQLQKGKYPLLEGIEDYETLVTLERDIDKLIKEYRDTISRILEHIKNWSWNDPVSQMYRELFSSEVIFDMAIDESQIKADLANRQIHKIPPGYKDSGKDDEGIGDLLIWRTILELGKQKSVIFVSGDIKPDWWHQSENQNLYPRYELFDEFCRVSNGKSFSIISFSEFLNLYGVTESAVEEVKQEEAQLTYAFRMGVVDEEVYAEQAVLEWVTRQFPNREIVRARQNDGFDYLISSDEDNDFTAIEVIYIRQKSGTDSTRRRVQKSLFHGANLIVSETIKNSIIVVVAMSGNTAVNARNKTFPNNIPHENISVYYGYVDESGAFMTV